MNIQYVVQLDKARIRRLTRAASPLYDIPYRFAIYAIIIVLAMIGGGVVGFYGIPLGWACLIVGLPMLGAFTGVVRPWRMWANLRWVMATPVGPTLNTITDTEIVANTLKRRRSIPWSAIASVKERDGVWMCRSADSAPQWAIYPDLIDPLQVAELRMFLVGRGALPQKDKVSV